MATGWAGDGAVQQQIDDSIEDAIKRARAQLPSGPSLSHCEECGEENFFLFGLTAEEVEATRAYYDPNALIEADRLAALGTLAAGIASLYNRRGSKDSQLR